MCVCDSLHMYVLLPYHPVLRTCPGIAPVGNHCLLSPTRRSCSRTHIHLSLSVPHVDDEEVLLLRRSFVARLAPVVGRRVPWGFPQQPFTLRWPTQRQATGCAARPAACRPVLYCRASFLPARVKIGGPRVAPQHPKTSTAQALNRYPAACACSRYLTCFTRSDLLAAQARCRAAEVL